MPAWRVLYLHGNDLTRPEIPSPNWANLTALTNLWLKDNELERSDTE